MNDLINLTNLSKTYNQGEDAEFVILKNISLTIEKGDFVSIMGPSGSGKTTLLNIIGLLDVITQGDYLFNGNNVATLNDSELSAIRNQKIGFVFQTFNLLARFNVLDNIILPSLYRRSTALQGPEIINDYREKAQQILTKVGLMDKANSKPTQLSGGEQQRIAIARALINSPELILADEPTGNLDSKTGMHIMEIFKNINSLGTTIILVTHDENNSQYGKHKIILKDGQIINSAS